MLKSKQLSKYYTKTDAVNQCINLFLKNIIIKENDIIIEPSAGNGAFINKIKSITSNYLFLDIEPEHNEILKQDYLKMNYSQLDKDKGIHILGNPPFGNYNKLARLFIKKSCEYADTISFILPSSFKKESQKKTFDKYFHLIEEIDLPFKSFTLDGKDHGVNCIFQIWKKKKIKRDTIIKLAPYKFKFVKKSENFREVSDIAFTRARSKAGSISTNIKNASDQYCYFIKFDSNINLQTLLPVLKSIQWKHNNTGTTQKSISQQEIIVQFNPIIEKFVDI